MFLTAAAMVESSRSFCSALQNTTGAVKSSHARTDQGRSHARLKGHVTFKRLGEFVRYFSTASAGFAWARL